MEKRRGEQYNMGKIKSALEIALERTESIKTDKASIGLFESRQQGKRLANEFLAGFAGGAGPAGDAKPSVNLNLLTDEIKKHPKEQQDSLKQGIFDGLIPQITLPSAADDMPRLEAVGKGLCILITDGNFAIMFKQLIQLFAQYLNETAQFDQAIRQQYAPKLRQKEEELSRRMGREVRLDPFQDPEFVGFYNQNINALKANYQAAADQVRDEAATIWEKRGAANT
jgi:hypothetical protein